MFCTAGSIHRRMKARDASLAEFPLGSRGVPPFCVACPGLEYRERVDRVLPDIMVPVVPAPDFTRPTRPDSPDRCALRRKESLGRGSGSDSSTRASSTNGSGAEGPRSGGLSKCKVAGTAGLLFCLRVLVSCVSRSRSLRGGGAKLPSIEICASAASLFVSLFSASVLSRAVALCFAWMVWWWECAKRRSARHGGGFLAGKRGPPKQSTSLADRGQHHHQTYGCAVLPRFHSPTTLIHPQMGKITRESVLGLHSLLSIEWYSSLIHLVLHLLSRLPRQPP